MWRRCRSPRTNTVIQTLALDRTHEPLREGVLPGTVGRGQDFTDSHALHAVLTRVTVDVVAIAEQIGWRRVVRERLDDLLGGPGRGGMLRHVEGPDAPPMVGEDDEDEQDTEAGGGHGEEVDRDHVGDMVSEERAPGLRGLGAPLRHEPGDGALGHLEAQRQEFAMDSGSTPQRIGRGHSRNQSADFGVDRWAARGGAAGALGPVVAEALPLPSQHSGWSNDDESPPPPCPHLGQRDPDRMKRLAIPYSVGVKSTTDFERGQRRTGRLAIHGSGLLSTILGRPALGGASGLIGEKHLARRVTGAAPTYVPRAEP